MDGQVNEKGLVEMCEVINCILFLLPDQSLVLLFDGVE